MTNPGSPGPGQPVAGTIHPAPKPVAAAVASTTAADASLSTPAPTNGKTEGEAKPKKKAKTKTGVARPRLTRPDENHVITVLRPKAKIRESGKRFDEYQNGMTVKQYIEKMTGEPWKRTVGQVYADLRWDTDPNRKLINIGPTVVPIPEPPKPAEQPKPAAAPAA